MRDEPSSRTRNETPGSLLDADVLLEPEPETKGARIFQAGRTLLEHLAAGAELSRGMLRSAMEAACGEENVEWAWKDAYEAAEAAVVLFLGRYGRALLEQARAGNGGRLEAASRMLASLLALEQREPPQTHRSEEQERHQQFSTPLPIAWCAAAAADVRDNDVVLEPSAGTGILAAMAAWRLKASDGGRLMLNELTETRADLLRSLFPHVDVQRLDGEHISNELPSAEPTLILMNPPFSRSAGVRKLRRNMDTRHVASAYRMLAPGGRLVTITSDGAVPGEDEWRAAFRNVDPRPTVVASERVAGKLYRKHGTSTSSRITVLEKNTPRTREDAVAGLRVWNDPDELLAALLRAMPSRQQTGRARAKASPRKPSPRKSFDTRKRRRAEPAQTHSWGPVGEIKYELVDRGDQRPEKDPAAGRPYETWKPRTLVIEGAGEHPTSLVESRAMAAILPPQPSYQPVLPLRITEQGLLSNAQVESVVLAGEAMSGFLPADYRVSTCWEHVHRCDAAAGPRARAVGDDVPQDVRWQAAPVRFRRGWMLGDGTGCGKGRQAAGILIDQWLRGRRRAIWFSQSDKLIEDARRDWTALGGHGSDIVPLNRFRQGEPVPLAQGVLFATYATLRSPTRQDRVSRLEQIVDWLAGSTSPEDCAAFEGCIVFDESHAMAKAAGGKGARGRIMPSQQGLAGLRIQNALPSARVIYVSATGASTVQGLAYARRLGLWNTADMPFEKREDFVSAMLDGGIAAMEVVSRDLKALGLYQARALSYDGVEIDILRHELTDEQREIYDEYARAFQIIHQHIDEALELTGIEDGEGCRNAQAKSAARSAFEGAKQRFFSHLLTSMKMPTLLAAIRTDLDEGRAPVVQLVSTGEALMERRLAEIPMAEWNDLTIDLTPREYMLDYLKRAFPTQAYVEVEDDEGNVTAQPKVDENGDRVDSVEAVRLRDELIEKLALLPPVQGALDQLIQTLGHDTVAEITGRTRRVVRIVDEQGERLAVKPRPETANLSEAEAFMNGTKDILVFSLAGGIGRSYHSDLGCANEKRRSHYLLDAGWRADQAIQGLGRTHRTNQRWAPLFRPVTTNVRGERRFISTIARRLDSLGAITRGQRNSQTAMGDDENQALFHTSDNFESPYAKKALRQFYWALLRNGIPGQSLKEFEERTGLDLSGAFVREGAQMPPMHTFLNRMLALEVDDQNTLFAEIEERIEANIDEAIENGTFNEGVETVHAESMRIVQERELYRHAASGAITTLVELIRRQRLRTWSPDEGLAIRDGELALGRRSMLLVNEESGRAAVQIDAPSWIDVENGAVTQRVRLCKPAGQPTMPALTLLATKWREANEEAWRSAWQEELRNTTPYTEDRVWLATGLLLPIWNRLPQSDVRVWRVRTDDGQDRIGRLLQLADVYKVAEEFGSHLDLQVEAHKLFNEIRNGKTRIKLRNGLAAVGRRVMGKPRVEIRGTSRDTVPLLKRLGCTVDVIASQHRVTVPDPDTLERICQRYQTHH